MKDERVSKICVKWKMKCEPLVVSTSNLLHCAHIPKHEREEQLEPSAVKHLMHIFHSLSDVMKKAKMARRARRLFRVVVSHMQGKGCTADDDSQPGRRNARPKRKK